MIQSILILRTSGETIYSKTHGNAKWNETLVSGFLSAAFNITQKMFNAEIQDIEMGPYRILFEVGEDIILTTFFEKHDSLIYVREKLIELKNIVLSKYGYVLKKRLCSLDEFEGLDEITEKIMADSAKLDINDAPKAKYIEILENLRSSNSEILDCDMISNKGIPLLKEWKKEFLDLCLRQMDAFWKTKRYALDQIIITYEQRHLILSKINENFVLSALIRRDTPIGYAMMLIEETASKLSKVK